MNSRKRILYFSHVPWQWIKQRPHFMAEELSKYFDVDFFYEIGYNKKNLIDNEVENNVKLKPIFRFPFNRFETIRKINSVLHKFYLSFISNSYDILYVTHPIVIDKFSKKSLKNFKLIIYDCMDDALSFPDVEKNQKRKNIIMKYESYLCNISDLILVSSENLKEKLIQRYNLKNEKIFLLHNAIKVYDNKYDKCSLIFPKDYINITYIGTIDKWIDFEAIKYAVSKNQNICFHFFGPLSIEDSVFKEERIIYHGIIPHVEVFKVIRQSDILLLPFIVNDLIESVNPVKLYEYLYEGKPVIASYYKELEIFKDYIYFYSNKEEFVEKIEDIIKNKFMPPKSPKECKSFASKNTWEKRGYFLKNLINSIIYNKR
jgi:teichuronic acid biosynthesis glycosyltransferase TuaH